jgi:TM2 domain-containing membrane protein YozV
MVLISAQTIAIENETQKLKQLEMTGNINNRKTEYQTEMTQSLQTVNTYLLFFYYFLFLLIHVLLAEQYFRGIQRDEITDTIWFTWFFLYPLVIYYIESYIYFAFSYITAFIYGKAYVYNFNSLLMNTDFYQEPIPATVPTLAVNT